MIPTRPIGGDIEGFTRIVALVKENADFPILIVVNCGNRFSATHSFMEWLGKFMVKEGLNLVK